MVSFLKCRIQNHTTRLQLETLNIGKRFFVLAQTTQQIAFKGDNKMKTRILIPILILVFSVLIITSNCATTPRTIEEHPMVVQRKIEHQDTKSNLFWLANDWMEMTLIDEGEGIQYRNEEEGVIVGQGIISQQSDDGFDVVYDFLYKLTIEVMENVVRTTIEVNTGTGEIKENVVILIEPHLMPREDYEELKDQFNAMIDDLVSYIENGSIALEYSNKGIAKAKAGDYKGAIKDFTRAIEINPDYAGAYNDRGIAKRLSGDYAGAIEDCTKAIEINPDHAFAYANRGNAKINLGDYVEALEDLSKAIELNPNHFGAYSNRGIAKGYIGDYEGAIEDYTKAIELNPDYLGTYINRGLLKGNVGDYEGAIEDHTKAIELNPEQADAYNNRGWTYIKMENYLDTISDLNNALSIIENASFYDTRGWAFFFLDRLEEARQDAISALELDSEAYNSRALLYRIEVEKGNKEEALESLKSYISQYEGKDVKDDYFLILKYFVNEVTIEELKNNPIWDDLKVALKYYYISDNQ
jgi:tetratricopeptide (TPR) repeat protein